MAVSTFAPAAALQPGVQTFHFEFPEAQYCGATLAGTGYTTLDIRDTVFFDGAGNPTRVQVQFNAFTTINSVTNGATVWGRRSNTVVIDLQSQSETHHGLDLMLHSTAGPIQVNAGAFQFDGNGNLAFVNGPHPFFTEDPNGPVCAVLTAS
jgi:hypothetical protein